MNVLLTLAYDGTNYHGWQRQENAISIQERLEDAISKVCKTEISVIGASRTDTGVHALGQRAMFAKNSNIPIEKFTYAINTQLGSDISVVKSEAVADDFHPRFSAKNKTYRYKIYNAPFRNPILRNYSWHVYHDLALEKMKEAAKYIIGEHDFSCFCASGGQAKTTVRTVYNLSLSKENNEICIDINGNGFLYNMVRIIAGTLVYAGMSKIEPKSIKDIILSKDRTRAGITAPPQGLTLMEINY
ncbi:MAG: tRNA pseudouridine(38-40) synthase TruA [Defluviitaleaceae bacterium]|nr:tRNA pseudouridine(38-40) synthase TruA [Defluviitaleaceae bacterium]